jgi:hypothetical protein
MSSVYDLNTHIKEHMEKMPKTLNTKKEIDEYFKFGIKEIIMKEKEKEKATKSSIKKPINDVESIVKPTKPPSKRKIFNDEMRIKIQDQFPGLSPEKMKQKLAELWKIHMDELFAWKPM